MAGIECGLNLQSGLVRGEAGGGGMQFSEDRGKSTTEGSPKLKLKGSSQAVSVASGRCLPSQYGSRKAKDQR